MCCTPPPSREELVDLLKIFLPPLLFIIALCAAMLIGRWLY